MRVEGPRSIVEDTAPLVRDFLGEVANRRPDHPAIESDAQTLTYRELLRASDGIAHDVTVLQFVPSRLRALVDAMPVAPGTDPPMQGARLVTFGGETVFGRDVNGKADAAQAWAPLLDGTVSTVAISGQHDGISRRPHVATLAARLGDALDRAM